MRYLILGVTEARDENGAVLPVNGTRLRALLAALALRAGRSVPVADLVDDIWGADPPHDAPAAVQALVGRLRRKLGRDAITSTHGGYRLEAGPDDVDLHAFERLSRRGAEELDSGDPATAARTLRTALGLWRGPALADLPGRDHGHALRPDAHRLAALERRIEADLRCAATGTGATAGPDDGRTGGPRTLVPELMELTAAHPYDERFRAQLIRALSAEGRQADALVAYEDARRTLADGLGADPGPELTGLHRELLTPSQPQPQSLSLSHSLSRPQLRPQSPTPSLSQPQPQPQPQPRSQPQPQPQPQPRSQPSSLSQPQPQPQSAPPSRVPAAAAGTSAAPVASPVAAAGNLRPRLTSFVGREPELRSIGADLTRSRLVTLTGPGGSGKTRLAEEAAAHGAPTEAWLAELASVEDPVDVPGAVLSALGLRETALLRDTSRDTQPPRTDPSGLLVEHLAHCSRIRPVLLILDNCEHVIDAAAALAETLLTHCPGLRILATSREPLGVPGESVRPVGPLPADPAHRLFAERARAVRPDFDPGQGAAHDADAVAEICRRLDGQPLAIELAAARLRMLGPRQIADRLDDRFRLLTGGSRTVLPRQQTLRAVVDWSWDLLDEDERTALRQVSVFAGSWDLQAAEAVVTSGPASPGAASAGPASPGPASPGPDPAGAASAGPDPAGAASPGPDSAGPLPGRLSTADLIGALVDKSLVVAAPAAAGEMRYRLLETIHEYAAERAAEAPETRAAAASAHTAYFLALVERAEPRIRSGEQLPWIERLETELDNIRAALHRTVLTGPSEPEAVRLVLGMGWFWWLRNFRTEGLTWTERAVALGPEPTDAADPRYWPRMHLEMLRHFLVLETRPTEDLHDDEDGQALMARVADAFRSSGPQSARFPGLLWPMATFRTGTVTGTHANIETAVENARVHGGAWEYCVTLMYRTHMVVDMPGGMPGVDADLAELRGLSRRVGDRWIRAQVASATAEAAVMRGRSAQARAAYEEALLLSREVGAHIEAPFLLARLAELAHLTGDLAAFDRLLTEAEREAERYQVHDARAYGQFLRAGVALERGDIVAARHLVTEAAGAVGRGSLPPHVNAVVDGLAARIAVREPGPGGGPVVGVRGLTAALRAARDAQCAELITGQLAEDVANVLPEVGRYGAAVRILAAADSWRPFDPRSEVQRSEAAGTERRAREELGAQLYESERAAGRTLTVDQVIELLTRITEELPGVPGAQGMPGVQRMPGPSGEPDRLTGS
ncbi:BTAD domain-containing putative transcriptional regulator [Streptomyces atratus]|uniref:AfsR/SARP family transcriptional regulator n=1 Tax=Streptomyces atratus TaxID=1893 RepID=UPI0021A32329|nr:BTAD domain-containing putative transcriptional regulator [Streptomyces atratus]MCT2546551.1 winged helix-turn-helix domain-containing protein [Streptomyces atratus]